MSENHVVSNYERLGGSFSRRGWVNDPKVIANLRPLISNLEDGLWLDVGSGAGDFAVLLAEKGSRIVGIDSSAHMLRSSSRVNAPLIPVQGDVHQLPFASESFHAVACRNVLKHCADKELAIRQLSRVSRRGAYMLIVESCAFDEADKRFMNSVIAVSEPRQSSFMTPPEWADLATARGGILLRQIEFTHRVISTSAYRIEQYAMDPAALSVHWKLFECAPEEIKDRKQIVQQVGGELSFLLSWTALLVQLG